MMKHQESSSYASFLKRVTCVLKRVTWFLPVLLLAAANAVALTSSGHSVAVYFNGGCPVCTRYVETLEHALNSAGVTGLIKYDYSTDDNALQDLSSLREQFDVPLELFGSATTIVDRKYLFEGYFPADAILDFVDSNSSCDKMIAAQGPNPNMYRLRLDDLTFECPSSQRIASCLSSGTSVSVLGTWALVLVSGLVNGLNPCGLLVLAYFVGVVSIHQSKRGIIKLGAFYVSSIFVINLGIGLGLLRLVLLSGYVDAISRVTGVFLALLAILSFKSALQRNALSPVRIPKRLISPIAKTFSHSWIKRSAVGAALLFGAMVAVLEFPCASGVYTAIIAVLSLQRMGSVMYFLGYNLMSMMPLTTLLVLSYSIASVPSLKDDIEKHKRHLRAISALLLLGLGAFLLLR